MIKKYCPNCDAELTDDDLEEWECLECGEELYEDTIKERNDDLSQDNEAGVMDFEDDGDDEDEDD